VIPVQLQWAYSLRWPPREFQASLPTIWKDDDYYCDLAFVDKVIKGEKRVCVPSYEYPPNFPGHVSPGSAIRLHLRASAENCRSRSTLAIEISWDGDWDDDAERMQKHLVIAEVGL
jgi:hypothetical protein